MAGEKRVEREEGENGARVVLAASLRHGEHSSGQSGWVRLS